MKDKGMANVVLGIRIIRRNEDIALSQSHHIQNMVKKFGKSECTPISTPYDSNLRLVPNENKPVAQLEYARVIVIYATMCTRPNKPFAIGKLSQSTTSQGRMHWYADHRVLEYLMSTINFGICYSGSPFSCKRVYRCKLEIK